MLEVAKIYQPKLMFVVHCIYSEISYCSNYTIPSPVIHMGPNANILQDSTQMPPPP